jgi:glyoxylase-like metal-dependent hydrolase (beta-lactamase superfamily II)
MTHSGLWVLAHEHQALLLDAPFSNDAGQNILDDTDRFLASHDLRVAFFTLSHLHWDHAAGIASIAEHYPDATFIYPSSWPMNGRPLLDKLKCCAISDAIWERSPRIAYAEHHTVLLSGEPVHLFRAPYHSPTDQVVVFRGVAVLPDWHLPRDLDEALQLVDAPRADRADTMKRLLAIQHDYHIHSHVPVHADGPLEHDFNSRISLALQRFS